MKLDHIDGAGVLDRVVGEQPVVLQQPAVEGELLQRRLDGLHRFYLLLEPSHRVVGIHSQRQVRPVQVPHENLHPLC
jgi:hypothetical protein